MQSQFLEQVQMLMKIQQLKQEENLFLQSNYMWLRRKKITIAWMSTKDEFKIRQALTKVTKEQETEIMKQLLSWVERNAEASFLKIPEITLNLIDNMAVSNIMKEVAFSRMASFRNSLRKLSTMSNKVSPDNLHVKVTEPRRSVTFNDIPIIYKIN